jgi:hypothetical protein
MKVELHEKDRMTIEQFADKYGLVMEVHERGKVDTARLGAAARYYAHFKHADIVDGACLAGVFGDGATPKAAIQSYAHKISGQMLVIGAFSSSERREIQVPTLVYL